jgi:hypothetical protein
MGTGAVPPSLPAMSMIGGRFDVDLDLDTGAVARRTW